MDRITGRDPFLTAVLPAPGSSDRQALLAGGLVLAVLVVVDLIVPSSVVTGIYVLAPFVGAMLGGVWATLILAIVAAAVGAASGDWNMNFGAVDYWARLGGLLIGGGFAVIGAWAMQRSRLSSARLQVLNEIGAIADGSLPLQETLRRVTEVIVPIAADLCMVDVIKDGRVMRAAVRAAGDPSSAAIEEGIRRRAPSVPAWMVDDVPQWRHLPRFLPRMRDEDLRRMAHDRADLEFLQGFAPRSSIAAPMLARDRSLGALTMVTAWSRRRYGPDDVRFAQILASRVALALDSAGIFSDLESVERRMDAVVSLVSEAVAVHDATGKLVFANLAAARWWGYDTAQELIDAPAEAMRSRFELFSEDGEPMNEPDPVRRRMERGALPWHSLLRVVVTRTGEERWARVAAQGIRGPDGEALYTITTVDDVTEVKRGELAQRLLAETGEQLASSLDHERTLAAVARLAVPRFADWCAVLVPGSDGQLEQLAAAGAGPDVAGFRRQLEHSDPGTLDGPRMLRDAGVGSVIVAPMSAGTRVLGVMAFANGSNARTFDDTDLAVAGEIARRAGVAFANARLARGQAEVARTLQRGLLPPRLPEMSGWKAAAMYRPAGEVNEVGGDFYDAFEYRDGWMILVGDVVGRGAGAATITALARHTIRTAGMLTGDPRAALAVLDQALREQGEVGLCSAVVVTVPREDHDPVGVGVVCAGHPPPLVLRDGRIEQLHTGGPMLGAIESAEWTVQHLELGHRDQIVLYTDGVTEAKGRSERLGEGRLRALLAGAPHPASAVSRIEAQLDGFLAGEPQDDAAAVVVQRVAPEEVGRRFGIEPARAAD